MSVDAKPDRNVSSHDYLAVYSPKGSDAIGNVPILVLSIYRFDPTVRPQSFERPRPLSPRLRKIFAR